MFVRPPDREVVCHASAPDPGWNDDLRIKMCIRPIHEDLVTLHHEIGHLYWVQPGLRQPESNVSVAAQVEESGTSGDQGGA